MADSTPPAPRYAALSPDGQLPDPAGIAAGTDMAGLHEPDLLRALGYWRGRIAAGRSWPDRADIDPLDIPDLLPGVVLWQTGPAGGWRARLVGTRMVAAHGYDYTGETMTDFLRGETTGIEAEYDWVQQHGRPLHARRRLFWVGRGYQPYHRILLPLGHRARTGDDSVALVLNVTVFPPPDPL